MLSNKIIKVVHYDLSINNKVEILLLKNSQNSHEENGYFSISPELVKSEPENIHLSTSKQQSFSEIKAKRAAEECINESEHSSGKISLNICLFYEFLTLQYKLCLETLLFYDY